MEKIINFPNNSNEQLRGILHVPDEQVIDNQKAVVIMLNAGIEDRIGPHRINVKLARRLEQNGHYVLRFDTHGVGLSDGELCAGTNISLFSTIQNGRFVQDVLTAINFVKNGLHAQRITLVGICGGAVSALLAAENELVVSNVILIDPPVYIDVEMGALGENPLEAKAFVQNGARKLLKWETWEKLFQFELDLKKTTSSTLVFIFNLPHILLKRFNPSHDLGRPLNRKFVSAFFSLVHRGKKVLFILAEGNIVGKEFEDKFKKRFLNRVDGRSFSIVEIKGANHEFHDLTSQKEVINSVTGWIKSNE